MKKLLLLLLLSGCTANGPVFNENALPKTDGATLIVYRDNVYYGAFGKIAFEINGQEFCRLHNSSFYVHSGLHDKVSVTASIWDMPGTSRIVIDTKPGKVYYVKMDIDSGKQISGGLGGLPGALIAEGIAPTGGPYIFTNISPEQAKSELAGLHQDCVK